VSQPALSSAIRRFGEGAGRDDRPTRTAVFGPDDSKRTSPDLAQQTLASLSNMREDATVAKIDHDRTLRIEPYDNLAVVPT